MPQKKRTRRTQPIRKSAVRKIVMDQAKAMGREGVITRIDSSVYVRLDDALRFSIEEMVRSHPSGFRTLKAERYTTRRTR